MKNLKVINVMMLLALVALLSCSKDNDNGPGTTNPTTVEQDKQNLKTTMDNTVSCAMSIRDGNFAQAVFQFLHLSYGEVLSDDWVEEILEELDEVADLENIGDENRFIYDYHKGYYAWNANTQSWDRAPSNTITLHFPSDENHAENNCDLVITGYEDEGHEIDDELVYLPTMVHVALKKDNSDIMTLNFASTYNANGFPVPVNTVVAVWMHPYNYQLRITQLSPMEFEAKFDMMDNDCATTIYGKILLAHNDYENLSEEDIMSAMGYVTKGGMKINGTWDVQTYNNMDDPTTEDLNSTMNVTVTNGGEKIGDLKFKDVDYDTELYIFYKDGTSENTSVYYDPFITDIKTVFEVYFGEDYKWMKRKPVWIKRLYSLL